MVIPDAEASIPIERRADVMESRRPVVIVADVILPRPDDLHRRGDSL